MFSRLFFKRYREMNEQVLQQMFALLRIGACGEKETQDIAYERYPELLPALYTLSKAHDLAHLVGYALERLGLLGTDEISAKFQKQQMMAIYRYQRLQYEREALCAVLERASIPFIPLKGAVIRAYYPQPWMRTSCDIDVLVRWEDLDTAVEWLSRELAYELKVRGSHDVSLYTQGNVHVELHYDLVEDDRANNARTILSEVWQHAEACEGYAYRKCLSEEFFCFYHIVHMAKHFEVGGCGVRPFLDLWLLRHVAKMQRLEQNTLLKRGSLEQFTDASLRLAEMWFGEAAEADPLCEQMQAYLLRGGVYGSMENRVAIRQKKQGGRIGYLLSRIFLPYDVLRFRYPNLQKHRWLYPFYQVCRWFEMIFRGGLKRSARELRYNGAIPAEQAELTGKLLVDLGLTEE